MTRWLPLVVCSSLLGCADVVAGDEAGSMAAPDPSTYAEGRVPLPECAAFDYRRCDIRSAACLENLAAIASCMRGRDSALAPPLVSFVSETEAELELLSDYEAVAPGPNYFEIALTGFGLTLPRAFEPQEMSARSAREWAAFYSNRRKEIIVIEHDEPLDPISENVVLLHEMIHALQDADHDLTAFSERYRLGSDGNLRGNSVIEGEARMHERRYFAALSGLDVTELDFTRSFDNLRNYYENWLFQQEDLYTASQFSVPYAHGAEYVFQVWSEGGQAAVRALFDAPPQNMREVLALAWGGDPHVEVTDFDPPLAQSADHFLQAWTTMGAWALYLLVEPRLTGGPSARDLALAWRGDQLEVFSSSSGEVVASWYIALSDATLASRLVTLLTGTPGIEAAQSDTTVALTTTIAAGP